MVFIFDENYSYRIAEALNLLEQGNLSRVKNIVEVWHILKLGKELGIKEENSSGSYSDAQVIQIAGIKKGIIVTQDTDFKRIKQMYTLYKQHKVGVVFFKTVIDSRGYWNMINYMISKWNDLKEKIQDKTPPFCFIVTPKGIQEYSF